MTKQFLFKPDIEGNDMVILPEEWKIIVLYDEYLWIERQRYGGEESHKKKIIKYAKKILNKEVNEKNFNNIIKEVDRFFYHEKSEINMTGSMFKYFGENILGPIGMANGLGALDIEDIEEVGAQTSVGCSGKIPFNKEVWGYFKSKTCGWCYWVILPGDESLVMKSLDENYARLVSWNHHNQIKCRTQLYEKKRKYENEGWKRSLGKTFVSNRFWYHDELEKFMKEIPRVKY